MRWILGLKRKRGVFLCDVAKCDHPCRVSIGSKTLLNFFGLHRIMRFLYPMSLSPSSLSLHVHSYICPFTQSVSHSRPTLLLLDSIHFPLALSSIPRKFPPFPLFSISKSNVTSQALSCRVACQCLPIRTLVLDWIGRCIAIALHPIPRMDPSSTWHERFSLRMGKILLKISLHLQCTDL